MTKKVSIRLLFNIAIISRMVMPVFASDHIDFFGSAGNTSIPRNLDLTDLYAWMPKEGKLVVALNSNLAASSLSQFSEGALYKFRIRNVEMKDAASGMLKIPNVTGTNKEEVTITCKIIKKKANCTTEKLIGLSTQNGLTVYNGLRADPFILDVNWAKKRFAETGAAKNILPLPLKNPANFTDYLNILNLTVEIDVKKILGVDTKLIAVSAEVSNKGRRVDRVGRPEITNMIIRTDMKIPFGAGSDGKPFMMSIKDLYNAVDTFQLPAKLTGAFSSFIAAGVKGWDKQDGVANWSGKSEADLVELLVNDYLVVDTRKVCAYNVKSFLDIEKSIDGKYTSCGGRTPSEDIIDTLTSLYVAGAKASKEAHGDGVYRTMNMPSKGAPYFAKPFTMPAKLR